MGAGSFEPSAVPVSADAPLLDHPVTLEGDPLRICAVGVGNPHCVVFLPDDPEAHPWRRWGAGLEGHPLFPNRTNVQFARVRAPGQIDAVVWERGAGETMASGSSACAVASAAVRTGRTPAGEVSVHMPGGVLEVHVGLDWQLTLTGPVTPIGRVEVVDSWLSDVG